jgi:hypothetical protein
MRTLSIAALVCGLTIAHNSLAAEEHKNFGFGMDLGVPSGLAAALIVKPNVNWLRFDFAATYNVIAPGLRGGFTLDPINFLISPSLTIDAGKTWSGNIPTRQAQIDMSYVNFHGGIELGSQKTVRFFIHAGPSYFVVHGNNLQTIFDSNQANLKLSNTSVRGWFTPTANAGFVYFF